MAYVLPCPRPSNQAVQRTPLARLVELGAIHVPSGAADRCPLGSQEYRRKQLSCTIYSAARHARLYMTRNPVSCHTIEAKRLFV